MQYRKDKYGNDISVLGYGCMRFTRARGAIDLSKAEKEIMEAFKSGVNYYDTAYVYPGSEEALGSILEKNGIRDKVYIATKLPHYLIKKPGDTEKLFQDELKRLRTDHVDYYLMHMLTDPLTWKRLTELGIPEWIKEKKQNGQIRQIGFSYHGNTDAFRGLIDAYPWDFCQIQYNYLDEHSQAGRAGLEYASAHGIPVIIMEPMRGGKLADKLPQKARAVFDAAPVKRSPVEWALKWLWNQPEVTCVLSGMNSTEQVRENVRIADETRAGELSEKDMETYAAAADAITAGTKVGCTGCRYCMPCPQHVDIPGIFAVYNRVGSDTLFGIMKDYFMCTGLRNKSTGPENCIGCGKCEQHCPQHIEIRNELKNAGKALNTPLYRIARWGFRKIMKY